MAQTNNKKIKHLRKQAVLSKQLINILKLRIEILAKQKELLMKGIEKKWIQNNALIQWISN